MTTKIGSEKEYSRIKAKLVGKGKGNYVFFVPPSADDFAGMLQKFEGKGIAGDNAKVWFKKYLHDPYARGMAAITRQRIALMKDYNALKKQIGIVPKNLNKKIPGDVFTNEQAVRVYIWNKQGMDIPGLSKKDLDSLVKYVKENEDLQIFGDQLISLHKDVGYPKPGKYWNSGTTTTDILKGIETEGRAKHLEEWKRNVDIIFSEKNLNKIEAAYGPNLREALTGILKRMETGRNRNFSTDTLTGKFTDWLNGAIGSIMFFNTRSSLLQTLSTVNFINYSDNNMFKAAKAFANQKQYWSDFKKLMNSDFLVDRRRGLRFNVNEADIANMAKEGGARGIINKLLEVGFLPTQIADSFAIAAGGATFYRNRIQTYVKQGMPQKQAEAKAFQEFREIAEETQQSSRPDRISQQQAGPLGRILLAFQNVTMQFNRRGKKDFLDLKNGRRVMKPEGGFHSLAKSRQIQISRMGYYFLVQNLMFNALQQGIFAIAFGNDIDEDKEQEKYFNIANGTLDSVLRGTGIMGGVVSVLKNAAIRINKESKKTNPKYEKVGYELTRISPPISSKLSKVTSAARSVQWNKEEMKEKGLSIDNPALLAGAQVINAATNVPLDRAIIKANNIADATESDLDTWERLALLGGWQKWELDMSDDRKTKKSKSNKTKDGKVKRNF